MKTGFYTKLAWSGMRKNSRLYTPYILTCTGMVMMFYIISYLAGSELVAGLRGGATIVSTMGMGCVVIGFFSLIFLFYTNSFLIRRRKKEFGLYCVLGMGKKNIALILVCETLLTAIIALGVGLVLGIALSKIAELCLVNILKQDVSFTFTVSVASVVRTLAVFAIIFLLILLNALRQVQFSNPSELMRSENVGEKPPKANWVIGMLGVILLAGAYLIAIQQPVQALFWFFIAVLMVIAATYMVFISGSVVFCRLLQKNKSYYYKPNHFVSVSSMVYRMKRNGAGLASICILATMVLVMISSTTCLYSGIEDSLAARHPNDINVGVGFYSMDDFYNGTLDETRQLLLEAASERDPAIERIQEYRRVGVYGLVSDSMLYYSDSQLANLSTFLDNDGCSVYFLPLEDYNALFDTQLTLSEDEAFICPYRTQYTGDSFSVYGGANLAGEGDP